MALYHIFLSYSRADSFVMERVRQMLQTEGLRVWVDQQGIPVGTPSWKLAIEQAIRDSACLLVLLSPDAARSQWVRAEIDYAESLNKPIFPLLIRGDANDSVPFGLTTTQMVDLRRDFTQGMQKLVQGVCQRLQVESYSQRTYRIQQEQARAAAQAELQRQATLQALKLAEQEAARRAAEERQRQEQERQRRREENAQRLAEHEKQVRALWALFLAPVEFNKYRFLTQEPIRLKNGVEIISTLMWFPLFVPLISLSLGIPPVSGHLPLGITFFIWAIVVIAAWAATNYIWKVEIDGMIVAAVGGGVTAVLAGIVGGGVVLGVRNGQLIALMLGLFVVTIGTISMVISDHFRLGDIPLGIILGIVGGITFGIVGTILGFPVGIGIGSLLGIVSAFAAGAGVYRAAYSLSLQLRQVIQAGKPSAFGKILLAALIVSHLAVMWLYLVPSYQG